MRIPTPSPTVWDEVSRSVFLSLVSPKNRLPLPSTTGNTIRRSSSTRSCSSSACASWALPATTISPPCRSLIFATSSASWAPSSTVELFQSGSFSVEETTYFGMLLNLSANSPSRDGHASAKPSYVLRPSRSASDSIVSSSLNLSPSSPRLISKLQPPCLKSSAPPGSSITPSSDTNSVTTIFPISMPPFPGPYPYDQGRREK